MNLHAVEPAELLFAVVHDANPHRQAGQCRFAPHPAAEFAPRLQQCDAAASMPRVLAASRPAGPAPTTSTDSGSLAGGAYSGCQPRRHSSPMVGFCVQRIGDIVRSPDTQMLHPMHSRISSTSPDWILAGRNGSAIEGRAAPMKSIMPERIWLTITSGLVNLPTPTTGLVVSCFRPFRCSVCDPSTAKRDGEESLAQSPTMKSHMSGSSPSSATTSSMSSRVNPCESDISSTQSRTATAARPSHSSVVSSISSRNNLMRLRSDPPYSSDRWL